MSSNDFKTTLDEPPLMVHVVAPTDLPEGYTFDAQVDEDPEKTFTAAVPAGGVKQGDSFLAPIPAHWASKPRIQSPTGRWKDGLFDFCSLGCMHPHFCCSLLCTQIAMGQVMQRMNFTWLGMPGPSFSTRNTFRVVVAITASYIVYSAALEIAGAPYGVNAPVFIAFPKFVGSLAFTVWAIYALMKTRQNVRAQYSIPEENCNGCEDVCCSVFCSCCSVAQILRHTGEYETYHSKYFTATGLEDGAPACV